MDVVMIRLISYAFGMYLQAMPGMSFGMVCLMLCELMCDFTCDSMCDLMCDLMCGKNELGRNE